MTNLSTGMSGSATDVVVSRAAGTGPATWAMGMLFERLVGAEDTGSLLGASIVTQPPGQASPLHVHTREAEAWFLLQGAMTYRAGERLVRMTAGDFIYETPGEAHTLVAYEHKDPMKVFFVVQGPLIWLDENGESTGHFDVHNYIALCRAHYEKVGLGGDYVKTLFR